MFFCEAPRKKLEVPPGKALDVDCLIESTKSKIEKINRSTKKKIALKSYSMYLLRVRREGDENISSVLLAARVGT